MDATPIEIARHKTAIRRPSFSLPVKCVLRDGLVDAAARFFDYGCGHGRDIDLLRDMGISCDGWDPVHRPHTQRRPAEVVNFGYVINVIEDPVERAEALQQAWQLCERLLVVAAQIDASAPGKVFAEYGDGVLTSRGTFQKYYTQHELHEYLETALGADPIPAAPGIFYVFKDESAKQQYVANRYRRRATVPTKRISELRFEQNRDVLEPFMAAVATLGRLPGPEEFPEAAELTQRFGSIKKAFALVKRVTDSAPWEAIAQRRTEDLLVYLALARFRKRPALSALPLALQRDIKAFLGSYRTACSRADILLFRAGDPQAIDEACQRASVGHLVHNALIVHRSALEILEPLLRIYEGCGRAVLGDIEEANVIKLHRFSGKLSYISYPDFENDPHPVLKLRVKLSLRNLAIDYFDYSQWADPPVLHRKELFLPPDHPLFEKFARLTRQEEKHGLLPAADASDTRGSWSTKLAAQGFVLRGHRLCQSSRCVVQE